MILRKIPTTFLIIALSAACAYAKKQPKYEQIHPLTPEQAALVGKAIGREKVLIKNIQQRTPLVETYIQDTRPDVKLYQIPVADSYMLSRVDFGKGFFDKTYEPRSSSKKGGWFKGSLASITNLTKALGLDTKFTYNPLGFTEMMFLDPSGFDQQHYVFNFACSRIGPAGEHPGAGAFTRSARADPRSNTPAPPDTGSAARGCRHAGGGMGTMHSTSGSRPEAGNR